MAVTQIRGNTQIIDATISNAKLAAGIDAVKIANGSVSNTEFQFLDGVTSSIQTQLTGKASTSLNNLSATAVNANITPANDGTINLGSTGKQWNNLWIRHLQADTTMLFTAFGNVNIAAIGADIVLNSQSGKIFLQTETYTDANAKNISNLADPASAQDAATMNYVDTSSSNTNYLHADGSVNATGDLNMNGNKITGLAAATAPGDATRFEQTVLTNGSHAITGDQSFSSTAKITNLVDPLAAQDAATKAYVDAAIAGLSWKEAAQVASTGDVTIATPGATLDGYTLVLGDRILLKDQAAPEENGVYVFDTAITPLVRSTDADSWAEIVGMVIYIEEGTANAGSKWVNTNVPGGTLDTTAITYTTFAAASAIDGVGTAGYNSYWTAAHTLAAEQYVATVRGGFATDVSAFTGVVKASGGTFTASSIVNADVDAAAGIVYTKLNLSNSIVNADIATGAGIVYSKLTLTGSVVNADIASGAAIDYSKLNLVGSIVNADIASGAAIAFSKLASLTSAHILVGDGSNVAADVAVSGDATLSNTGVLSISTGITNHHVTREVPTGAVDSSNVTFSLATAPLSGQESIFVNGILQNVGALNDYTISGTTITFNTAPTTGDVVLVSYFK